MHLAMFILHVMCLFFFWPGLVLTLPLHLALWLLKDLTDLFILGMKSLAEHLKQRRERPAEHFKKKRERG